MIIFLVNLCNSRDSYLNLAISLCMSISLVTKTFEYLTPIPSNELKLNCKQISSYPNPIPIPSQFYSNSNSIPITITFLSSPYLISIL